jgi:hypothetical protein
VSTSVMLPESSGSVTEFLATGAAPNRTDVETAFDYQRITYMFLFAYESVREHGPVVTRPTVFADSPGRHRESAAQP